LSKQWERYIQELEQKCKNCCDNPNYSEDDNQSGNNRFTSKASTTNLPPSGYRNPYPRIFNNKKTISIKSFQAIIKAISQVISTIQKFIWYVISIIKHQ